MYQSKWAPQAEAPKAARPASDKPATESEPATDARPISNRSLSASAPSFEPAPVEPAAVEEFSDAFAQTAQEDDLFDDVVPLEESMQTRPPEDLFGDEFTPVAEPVVERMAPEPPTERGRGGRTSRGRGRGRAGRGGTGRGGAKADQGADNELQSNPLDQPSNIVRNKTGQTNYLDRQNAGGVRKPKLSEAELAEKMAAIQIKNASLTAAHARAEADAASFAEREEQAKKEAAQAKVEAEQRRREERRDRQQMMGERERNRMRKLKAMDGREWDREKDEQDFEKGGRFDTRGGFAGDAPDYTDGREYIYRERRGGGGGPRRAAQGGKQEGPQSAPRREDFPALPGANTSKAGIQAPEVAKASEADTLKTSAGRSWAEQVESSAA